MYAFVVAAAVVALVDLLAVALGWPQVRTFTKAVPALLLAVAVVRSPATSRWLAAGLCFAALGDALLLRHGDLTFVGGMGAFAAMHVCYIAGFSRIGTGPGFVRRMPWLAIPYALAALGLDVTLWPHAGTFALPVTTYGVLLAAMALSALDAAGRIANASAARALAGGALIFMASDTLLAMTKFWPGFPLSGTGAEFAVMTTYFAAQIAITYGAIASS